MYIKDAIYKTVPIGMTPPINEGTIVTINGQQASLVGTDAYGIVTEKIEVAPPTGRMYVAVSGTIDLDTCGVTFNESQIQVLGRDFNFVPANEGADYDRLLPDYDTSTDGFKVLQVKGSSPNWGVKIPLPMNDDTGKTVMVKSNGQFEYKQQNTFLQLGGDLTYENGSWSFEPGSLSPTPSGTNSLLEDAYGAAISGLLYAFIAVDDGANRRDVATMNVQVIGDNGGVYSGDYLAITLFDACGIDQNPATNKKFTILWGYDSLGETDWTDVYVE